MYIIKNIIIIFISIFYSCGTLNPPADFSDPYNAKETGLDKQINIDGIYISPRDCDSAFYSIYMFYPDGLFTLATTKNKSKELLECFAIGGKSKICEYAEWGTYKLEGKIIKTQTIRDEGIAKCTIFRDYEIQSDKSLINISDYVISENCKIGYMKNYPSYLSSTCRKKSSFYPSSKKREKLDCSFLKKKWFYKK